MKSLRPLRMLVPIVAIVAALGLFLGIGFIAFNVSGGGGSASTGTCDTGVGVGVGLGGRAGTSIGDLSDEQRTNASTIIGVARDMGTPPRAWLIALATAMQESTLRNINYGDRDSLGLFQQRPSQGWGTPAQVTDPVYSTRTFLDRLLQIPGWETLPVTVAAQKVSAPRSPTRTRSGRGWRPSSSHSWPTSRRSRPAAARRPRRWAGGRGRGDRVRAQGGRQALRVGRHRAGHLRLLRADAAGVPGRGHRAAPGVAWTSSTRAGTFR